MLQIDGNVFNLIVVTYYSIRGNIVENLFDTFAENWRTEHGFCPTFPMHQSMRDTPFSYILLYQFHVSPPLPAAIDSITHAYDSRPLHLSRFFDLPPYCQVLYVHLIVI